MGNMVYNGSTIMHQSDPELAYRAALGRDLELIRAKIALWQAGGISEADFRAFRLLHGIYGQRQPGLHMIRVRIPAGMLSAAQMRVLARIAERFAGSRAHLSTRQDVQFHLVPLDQVVPVLELLVGAGLTTRETGSNTVRNVTVCPLAGICGEELFDVAGHARTLAWAFLGSPVASGLPRKFKIAVSGCQRDCAVSGIHDLGLTAVVRAENGAPRHGFRAVAGGGLGPFPVRAELLEEFVPEDRVLTLCRAVVRVFARHGNRTNRHKARLKFVLRERGIGWLRSAVRAEIAEIGEETPEPLAAVPGIFGGCLPPAGAARRKREAPDADYDAWARANVVPQRQAGRAAVFVNVPEGNLTGDQMRLLADLAEQAGDGHLRTTATQDIVLTSVPQVNLPRVHRLLKSAALGAPGAREVADITACPGSYCCNRGITKSMNLAAALREVVASYAERAVRQLSIKVSGCPNSCAHHWIADLGLFGNARRIDGQEVPYYRILLGGSPGGDRDVQFGVAVASVPARLVPRAVARILDDYVASRLPDEAFRDYVLRRGPAFFEAMAGDLSRRLSLTDEMGRDWGDEVAFSVKLGRAECA